MEPNPPWTVSVISLPTTLPMCHQVVAATTRAAPRNARPTPSLRCIGSRSAALRPSARATEPAACATTIHAAVMTRAIHPNRMTNGSVAGGRCVRRAALRPLPFLGLLPRPPYGARVLLLTRVRDEVPAGRGREAVLPCGRVPPVCDPLVLGTRVAMMTTVTTTTESGRKTRRAPRRQRNAPAGRLPVRSRRDRGHPRRDRGRLPARPRRCLTQTSAITTEAQRVSDVYHHGDDHGTAPVVLVHPPADDPPHELAHLAGVVDPFGRARRHRLLDLRDHRAERGVVDSRAPGVDLRRGGQLPRGRVDHHDDRDEPLVPKDPPILQRGLGHLADRQAVHVDVPALDRAGDCGLPVRSEERR